MLSHDVSHGVSHDHDVSSDKWEQEEMEKGFMTVDKRDCEISILNSYRIIS